MLLLPRQFALILFPQRRAAGPIIAADEQHQEGDRQEVEGLNGENHHAEKIRADAPTRTAATKIVQRLVEILNIKKGEKIKKFFSFCI